MITDETLSIILPLHSSSLLFLVGGSRSPHYAPNKVIFWDDAQGKEVAELEFQDRIKGIVCCRQTLAVTLKRRIVTRMGEWETGDNERGLVALATTPGATLMVTTGHLHLITPSSSPAYQVHHPPALRVRRDPLSHIKAHTSAITTITISPSSRYVASTSEMGTLIRIWNTENGNNAHEFRRGIDQAHFFGVAFRPDERECRACSDKGTVHVFSLERSPTISTLSGHTLNFKLPTPPAHVAHSLSQTNRLGIAHPDAGHQERWTIGWITMPPDITPQSSPKKGPIPLPSVHAQGKARPESSSLSSYRQSPRSPTSPTRQIARPLPEPEYQLVALTFTGGWYRLSSPGKDLRDGSEVEDAYRKSSQARAANRRSDGASSVGRTSSPEPGKKRQTEHLRQGESSSRRNSDSQDTSKCQLEEFRRFGRWDGWG
ncbi:hypothetical protein CPB86DRAFT_775869 [Serendipita vermifera]|nr:hypothetical protein CPB86DRAFT_775869 [Serendipita vermifera]